MTTRIRRRGRPCGLTPQKEKCLFNAIRQGLTYRQAAALAGISYMTFNRWKKRGALDDAPPELRDFCDHIAEAEAKAALACVSTISKAGRRDWRASAWILERRYPEDWGRREYVPPAPPAPSIYDLMEDYPPKVIDSIFRKLDSREKTSAAQTSAATENQASNFATVSKSERN